MGMGLFYVTVFVFFLDVVVLVICWVFECWTWCFGGVVVVKCVAKLVRRMSANLVFGVVGRTGNGKCKSEIQGSLHCASDGDAVRCFGRDDGVLGCVGGEQATADCDGC
jgi:hypothetical protein